MNRMTPVTFAFNILTAALARLALFMLMCITARAPV